VHNRTDAFAKGGHGRSRARGDGSPHDPEENTVNLLTTFRDVAGALLLVFLLPVWMALGLVAVAAVVTRQLYWWARGNTTVVSRVVAHVSAP
jgi:hypothetical protein